MCFLTFVVDYSRMIFVNFLKHKSKVDSGRRDFVAFVERITVNKVKCFRSDNGGEYNSTRWFEYLNEHGIRFDKTETYKPQQNGVAERTKCGSMDKAHAMMQCMTGPTLFWAESLATAVHGCNILPPSVIDWETPGSWWTSKISRINHLGAFGCRIKVLIQRAERTKLDSTLKNYIYIWDVQKCGKITDLWYYISKTDRYWKSQILWIGWCSRYLESIQGVQSILRVPKPYGNGAELHDDRDSTTHSDIIDSIEEDHSQVQIDSGNESTVGETENTVVEKEVLRKDPVTEDKHQADSHMSILWLMTKTVTWLICLSHMSFPVIWKQRMTKSLMNGQLQCKNRCRLFTSTRGGSLFTCQKSIKY